MGQIFVYWLLLLLDEYFGTLVALIIGAIALSLWLLSYVVEWIERSRVGPSYYRYMLTAWIAPLLALFSFILLRGGVGWL